MTPGIAKLIKMADLTISSINVIVEERIVPSGTGEEANPMGTMTYYLTTTP